MNVVVFGASGLAGRHVARELHRVGHQVYQHTSKTDLRIDGAVGLAMAHPKPDAVVNCAAYANADAAEDDPVTAHAVNELGAWSVARWARKHGARLVHLSTNFVYPDSPGPLASTVGSAMETSAWELEEVREQMRLADGVYARSKLRGDVHVLRESPEHIVLRTQSIYGDRGGNYVSKVAGMLMRGERSTLDPVRVVSPTHAQDLAVVVRRILDLPLARKEPPVLAGVVHFQLDGTTTWAQWGRRLAGLLGADPGLVEDFVPPYKAPRPRVGLYCAKLRDAGIPVDAWESGLERYAAQVLEDTPL